jgi:hypothetical protein
VAVAIIGIAEGLVANGVEALMLFDKALKRENRGLHFEAHGYR